MRFERVAIAGIGYEVPPVELTSSAIEDALAVVYERLGLHRGRLELMTGIRSRRYWSGDVVPSTVATAAGRTALARSRVAADRIGCLIHASVCRDFLEPATANVVHNALGLPATATVFDLSNACLGVMNAMIMVANMIELGQIEAGLVVAGENGKPLVDATIERLLSDSGLTRKSIKGSIASLTIGAGAAAVLLASTDLCPDGHRLRTATVRAATEHNQLCRGGDAGAGHVPQDAGVSASSNLDMSTDAEALLMAGLDLAEANWADFCRDNEWAAPQRVVTHQVGRAHHIALSTRLGFDPESTFVTFDRLGNVGSVSLPMTLGMAVDDGFIRPGHTVGLLGIGSGL
ncbi:MAG: 3-oxoacyl-ACP synthase III, partial [Myxococcota bacterium]